MISTLSVGIFMIILCLLVQCFVLALVLRYLVQVETKKGIKNSIAGSAFLLSTILFITVCGNLIQIAIWAELFVMLGEFESYGKAFYHSAVNFSTLGYGDFVMSNEHKLLGALEAVNGVLMFGLSTGFMYAIIHAILLRAWDSKISKRKVSSI